MVDAAFPRHRIGGMTLNAPATASDAEADLFMMFSLMAVRFGRGVASGHERKPAPYLFVRSRLRDMVAEQEDGAGGGWIQPPSVVQAGGSCFLPSSGDTEVENTVCDKFTEYYSRLRRAVDTAGENSYVSVRVVMEPEKWSASLKSTQTANERIPGQAVHLSLLRRRPPMIGQVGGVSPRERR